MSNYKSELQSNNTDLQSIADQIDELGDIVSEQEPFIQQIKSALRGSGGTTVDDIGVFTIEDYSNLQFLFIKGMTFKELQESKLNTPFYLHDYLYEIDKYYSISTIGTGGGLSLGYISLDGSNIVSDDTIIEARMYKLYRLIDDWE